MSAHQPFLRLGQEYFRLTPGIRLILDIEEELGSLAGLLEKLQGQSWKVSELVTLVHILLEHEGRELDYIVLGQRMLEEGLRGFLASAVEFLRLCLQEGALVSVVPVRVAH